MILAWDYYFINLDYKSFQIFLFQLNGKDSEDKKDDFVSDTNTQEETLQTAPPKSMVNIYMI